MAIGSVSQNVNLTATMKENASTGFDNIGDAANKNLGDKPGGVGFVSKGAKLALLGVAAGATAVVGGIAASVKVAADFESSMAKVGATTGATGKDFDRLRQLAKDMGSSTSFSASEAAEGMNFLAMAGLSVDDTMTVLPKTLKLAAAGGLELGEAADISTNIMSGMGMGVDDLDHIINGLAQTARSSNTNIAQMGQAMKFVAPTAQTAGISFDETAAALGTLASSGLSASVGGNTLNASIRSMLAPSKEAKKELTRMGLSFTDNEGKMKPLVQITDELAEKNLTASQMFELFGAEGARGISLLTSPANRLMLRSLTGSIENVGDVAAEMADRQMNTFEGSMKGLSSAVEGLMITVGEEFIPVLSSLVKDYVTPAIRAFSDFMENVGGLGQLFDDAVDLVVGFGKGYFKVIDNIFSNSSYRESFIGLLGSIFDGAVTLVTNFASNAGTVIWEFAQVVWEPIKFGFSLIWEPIKAFAVKGINAVGEAFTTGINAIIDKVNTIGEALGITIERVDFTPLTEDAPKSVEDRWADMKTNMSSHWDAMSNASSQLADDIIKDSADFSKSTDAVWDEIVAEVDDSTKSIAQKYEKNTLKAMEKASKKSGKKQGKEMGKAASDELQSQGIKDEFNRRGDKLGGWFGAGFAKSIGDKMSAGMGKGMSAGMDLLKSDNKLATAANALGGVVGGLIGGPIGAMVGQMAGDALGKLGAIFGGKGRAESRKDVIGEIHESIGQGDLANFAAFNNLKRTLDNAGSARMTADAIATSFGISFDEAVDLINVFRTLKGGGRSNLSKKQTKLLDDMNERLGANEAAAQLERAQLSLVGAADGFSGVVNRPTVFLTGEGGRPEHVQVTPMGGGGGGQFMGGGDTFNFFLTSLGQKDTRDVVENELMPMIVEQLQTRSRFGDNIMHSDGVIQDKAIG